jgi:hypothetical protein
MIWMIQRTAVTSGRNVEELDDWMILVLKRPVERHERIIQEIYPVDDLDDSENSSSLWPKYGRYGRFGDTSPLWLKHGRYGRMEGFGPEAACRAA